MGFSLEDPERKSYKTLIDEMSLSPERLQVVMELLERHEASLENLSEEQEADRRRRIRKAYRIIQEHKGQREDKAQPDAGDSE